MASPPPRCFRCGTAIGDEPYLEGQLRIHPSATHPTRPPLRPLPTLPAHPNQTFTILVHAACYHSFIHPSTGFFDLSARPVYPRPTSS